MACSPRPIRYRCIRCKLAVFCYVRDLSAHAAECEFVRTNFGDTNLVEECKRIYDAGWTSVFNSHDCRGLGLKANRDIPKGTRVACVPGTNIGDDSNSPSLGAYSILMQKVLSISCVPEGIKGVLINDAMSPESFGALIRGDLPTAIIGMLNDGAHCANTLWETDAKNPNIIWMVTTRVILPGAELLTAYGPNYWLNMLASGTLPGSSFYGAWRANNALIRGDRALQSAVVDYFRLQHRGRSEQMDTIRAVLGITVATVPIWLKFRDVLIVHVNDNCNPDAPQKTAVVQAPWVPKGAVTSSGTLPLMRSVLIIALGLRHLAISAEEKDYARREVYKHLMEATDSKPLADRFSRDIINQPDGKKIVLGVDAMIRTQ